MTPGAEVKHTPGPWERVGSGVYANSGREIIFGRHNTRSADYDEREANAALIAAAPDLLAALKETAQLAQEMLSDRARSDRTGMGELLARQAARAILTTASAAIAIARAEGRDAK